MELAEIFPENATFSLSKTGKEYHLRIVNLEDQVWVRNNLGNENDIKKMFENLEFEKICRFVYRLLIEKNDFTSYMENTINDDGDLIDQKVSGPQAFMRCVQGQNEALKIIVALTSAIIASDPIVKELVNTEVKKKAQELQAGMKSLTQSQVNMDGPKNKSESSQ